MAITLSSIKKPIETELKTFEGKFKAAMKSNVALLDKITQYLVKRKGKQMRPMFVFLSAKICGQVTDSTYHAASLVELLHTATLVHDDVVDDSYERRGFFSLNALYKNKAAVLVGDFLLSQGLMLALENKEHTLLEIFTRAIREMIEGELLQLEKARRLDIEEPIYFEIIRQKTASLIASACCAGAASTGADEAMVKKIKLLGEKIGIAFQIRDDLFDFGEEEVGKPRGIDIKEKKMTLPLIYALNNAGKKQKRKIINVIRKHNEEPDRVAEVISFVRASGGLEYSKKAMYDYRQQAFDILHSLPETDARKAMEDLVTFVTERES